MEATQVMIEIKNLSKKNKKGQTGFEEKFKVCGTWVGVILSKMTIAASHSPRERRYRKKQF